MTSKATNQELQQRKNAATPRGVGVMCDFYAERASNAELWDVEGRRFIDFAAGIAVLNTGHRHPKLLDAMRAQLDKFTHTAYQIVPYASYVELAERINAGRFFAQNGGDVPRHGDWVARQGERDRGRFQFLRCTHGTSSSTWWLLAMEFGPFGSVCQHTPPAPRWCKPLYAA